MRCTCPSVHTLLGVGPRAACRVEKAAFSLLKLDWLLEAALLLICVLLFATGYR